jgi:dTDP-4-dehydrorhamnose 3,5-epimerase-like enzyme
VKDWKQTLFDDESMWPERGLVALPAAHIDERGAIQPLVDFPMKNVSLISSKRGSVRSNHYHLTDWHYMYVLSGSFDYYFRPNGSSDKPKRITLRAGEILFTPPLEEHATLFLEDTQIVVASRNPRDQEIYEADVRRIVLLDPTTLR